MDLNIGKKLYPIISNLVGHRVYPIVAEQGTKKPFIVYQTETQRPNGTKDGLFDWVHSTAIRCVCDKYDEVVELSQDVVEAIENSQLADDINIITITEYYEDNAYVKEITIETYN